MHIPYLFQKPLPVSSLTRLNSRKDAFCIGNPFLPNSQLAISRSTQTPELTMLLPINKGGAIIENASEFESSLTTKTTPNCHKSALQNILLSNHSFSLLDRVNHLNNQDTFLGKQHMYKQPCKM